MMALVTNLREPAYAVKHKKCGFCSVEIGDIVLTLELHNKSCDK